MSEGGLEFIVEPPEFSVSTKPILPRKRRIVLYFPMLAGGGAERLYLNLTPYFIEAEWDVVFLVDKLGGALVGSVPKGAQLVQLDADRLRHSLPKLIRYLRREQPDILLSSISPNNAAVLLAKLATRIPTQFLITQHNTLSRETNNGGIYRILPFAFRVLLRFADDVAAVSNGVAADLARSTGFDAAKISVIPNGVVTDDFAARAGAACPHPWLPPTGGPVLLAVGRLTSQKDFATLIRAFAELRRHRPAKLIILGEGPDRADLTELACSLGVADSVDMPGYVANPLAYISNASVLVLSSAYEGFGLVLAEALACGTPVVSTNCDHGPAEILEDGRYGALVPVGDWSSMAAAIGDTLDRPPERSTLQGRGSAYSIATCAARYIELFETMLRA
jgi:glycosyltransferase involved in cell wall biosynthesis